MFGRGKRIEAQISALTAGIERLCNRLEATPVNAPVPAGGDAFASVAAALVQLATASHTRDSDRNEQYQKLIGTFLEKAGKLAMSATASDMGRKSVEARKKKALATDPNRAYFNEVCRNCAVCESKLTGKPERAPGHLARHLMEGHEEEIIPAARRAMESFAPELPFNGSANGSGEPVQ